jgi:hypothetical protein
VVVVMAVAVLVVMGVGGVGGGGGGGGGDGGGYHSGSNNRSLVRSFMLNTLHQLSLY